MAYAGGYVEVSGNGAVLQGLSIPYTVDVTGSGVTIKDVRITATGNSSGSASGTPAMSRWKTRIFPARIRIPGG